jgi:hypothetical protein
MLECGVSERRDGGTLQVLASMPARSVSMAARRETSSTALMYSPASVASSIPAHGV